MTPEQMREAAAKIAADVKTELVNSAEGECISNIIARRIRAIPITPPEPAMTDRMASAVCADTGYLCSRGTVSRVLEAMRKPTEAMVKAVYRDCRTLNDFKSMWRIAIDAALAEK